MPSPLFDEKRSQITAARLMKDNWRSYGICYL